MCGGVFVTYCIAPPTILPKRVRSTGGQELL
jgi:hypothetical protein